MRYKITLFAQHGIDSKEEIKRELEVLREITGVPPRSGVEAGQNFAVFEGEFHEFYRKVKGRIMSKIKAYE